MRIGFLTLRMLLGYGVDLVVGELARRLAEDGHEVIVFTTAYDETYPQQGFRIEKLDVFGGEFNRALPIYEWNASKAMKRISKALSQCDVVVPATFPFYGVRSAFQGPVVHFDFGNVPTAGFSLRGKANWLYLHAAETHWHTLRADAVITISRFLAQRFLPEAKRKLHVVYIGGDHYYSKLAQGGGTQQALREALRNKLGISQAEVALGCCSRLHRKHAQYKNVNGLISIWENLRARGLPIRLVLAGLGSPEDVAWLAGRGADTLPNLPPEDMPAYYSALDIYASPSEWEGFNLPLVEAAWFGVPAVAYEVAAHPETTASLLAKSPDEFGGFIAKLAADSKLRERLGAASFAKAQGFSWNNTYRAFKEVVAGVTKE